MFEAQDIEQLILERAKKPRFTQLHRYFVANPLALFPLIALAFSNKKHPIPAYSAWLLVHVAKAKPQLLYRLQEQLETGLLANARHDVQRSLLSVLLLLPLRHKNEGALLDLYFTIFQDQNKQVANRVYALYHLKRLCKKYPEIDTEVRAQINIMQELGPMKPGLKVSVQNYLNT